jgi:hypothetical protein
MNFLVVSQYHDLIPFAYRLKNQGNKTELVICTRRYEKAWKGKFDCVLPAKEVNAENLQGALDLARAGEVVVISDSFNTSRMFEGVENFYGVTKSHEFEKPTSPVRVGAWYSDGKFSNPHLLIYDLGTWPGGLGPLVPGGLTLVRIEGENVGLFRGLVSHLEGLLSEQNFQGLLQVGVREDPVKGLVPEGLQLGWPFLQSHAFVSELDSFSSLLEKSPQALPKKVVAVVPVSLPPWPDHYTVGSRAGVEVGGLTPKQVAQIFWHDVQLDSETRTITSGGLDGLLGIARGSADTALLAVLKARTLVQAISVEEKQYRPDFGAAVESTLAQLEARFGIVL